MKAFSTLLLGAAAAMLGACGGGGDAGEAGAENNLAAADVVTLPEDEGEIGGSTLGNDLDALGAEGAGDLNAADANLAGDTNLSGDANLAADANAAGNAQ